MLLFTKATKHPHSRLRSFLRLLVITGLTGIYLSGCDACQDTGPDYAFGLRIGAITATFNQATFTTTYKVRATYDGDPSSPRLHYAWSKDNQRVCGTFTPKDTSTIFWTHPHAMVGGNCPDESFHPGILTVVVTATGPLPGDTALTLTATYPNGSEAGTGPQPAKIYDTYDTGVK